jgi:tetratricopeptide (TPR) repeat protein
MQLTKTESLRQARQHIAEGRVSLAMSIYQKIVDGDSSDLAAISMLGDLYVKAGRIADAVEHFLRIAENLLRSGSAISAAYILKKVLKIDPTNPVAHMNLGELHFHDNKIDSAHDAFIEAGAGFWHTGNKTEAVRMNRRALEIMPSSRHAKAALALIQREIDQPELAEPKKEFACELPDIIISIPDGSDAVCAPGTSDSIDSPSQWGSVPARDEDVITELIATAEFLVGCGQVDQAIGLLRESLQDKPDHIQIREKLKDIYLRSEMIDRASEECVNIAAIYRARGESSRAADYVIRARLLRSSVELVSPLATSQTSGVEEPEGVQETGSEWEHEPLQPVAVM